MFYAILLAITLLLGSSAHAQDQPIPAPFVQKVVGGPATEWCKTVQVPGEILAQSDVVNRPQGGFYNVSNLYSTVVCSGMIYNRQVFIDFADDSNGGYITCQARTWSPDGGLTPLEARASTVYNTKRERSTFYWKLPINYLGYFQVICKLAPRTSVIGFYNIALPFE